MWILPARVPDAARAALPPGLYLVPPWLSADEVERLVELLGRFVGGIDHALLLPWESLSVLAGRAGKRLDRTLCAVQIEDPETGQEQLEALHVALGFRHLLVQLEAPPEAEGFSWQEQHLKRALVTLIRAHVAAPEHPLAMLGIAELPVTQAASLTTDMLEMVDLLESAAAHRLRFVSFGASPSDWHRSLMLAAGKRLATRLSCISGEDLPCALEIVLGQGKGDGEERFRRGSTALAQVGLAQVVAGDLSVGPLVRRLKEREVWGMLLKEIPAVHWSPRADELLRHLTSSFGAAEPDVPTFALSAGLTMPAAHLPLDEVLPSISGPKDITMLIEEADATRDQSPMAPALYRRLANAWAWLRQREDTHPRERNSARAVRALLRLIMLRDDPDPGAIEEAMRELEVVAELELDPAWAHLLAGVRPGLARRMAVRANDAAELTRLSEWNARSLQMLDSNTPEGALACLAQGEIELARGRHDEAADYLEHAYSVFRAHGRMTDAMYTAFVLFGVQLQQGGPEHAKELVSATLAEIPPSEKPAEQALRRLLQSGLLLLQAKVDGAIEALNEAADMARSAGAGAILELIRSFVGPMRAGIATRPKGQELLRQFSLETAPNAAPILLAQRQTAQGREATRRGAYDEARAAYEEALAFYERIENIPEQRRLCEALRDLAELRGDDADRAHWQARVDALSDPPA